MGVGAGHLVPSGLTVGPLLLAVGDKWIDEDGAGV